MARIVLRSLGATAAVATAAMWNEMPAAADDGPLSDPNASTTEEVLAMQDEIPRPAELSDALTARYPESFGGVYLVPETQALVVQLVAGGLRIFARGSLATA